MPSEATVPILSAAEPGQAGLHSVAALAVAAIVAITGWRLGFALFDRTELSTDEAQYWAWGQSLAFGYYSKPPLIGWIIRGSTDLLGQSVAAVRLAAPVFHAATALILLQVARRVLPVRVAAIAALSYLTMPAVAVGSALMTTDTPMLTFAALALVLQVRLAEARAGSKSATGLALLLGLALGVGLLAKHAMLFWLTGAGLAAWASPHFRLRASDTLTAAAAMLAVVAPHLWWLARSDFITLAHVQRITQGDGLSLMRPLVFLAQQALVIGPVLVIAMALAVAGTRRSTLTAGLVALTLTPLAIVLAQGVKGPVLANWAVLSLLPGSVLAAMWLVRRPLAASLSLALGLAVTLALPLVKVFPTALPQREGKPLMARYLGHEDTARRALRAAADARAATLVIPDRDLMADLLWFGPDTAPTLRALPPKGRPAHHWELTAAFDPATDPGPVALIWPVGQPLPCASAIPVGRFTAPPGAYGGRSYQMLRLTAPDCLRQQEATG
ncbi:MAG: glycosyltransferase family 39 protein [Pseudomonadota bacterium]